MNKTEMEQRDRVLRHYFAGRDWDGNREYAITRDLVLHSPTLLPDYPLLIDYEWEVEPNQTHEGKGDLIFSDGVQRFAVVEVKWLDQRTGKRPRTSRNQGRTKVKQQAEEYTRFLAQRLGEKAVVEGYWFTNQDTQPQPIQSSS